MKSELLFKGTPAHFGIAVRQFDDGRDIFQVETQDIARKLNSSLKELFEDLSAPSSYFPEPPEILSDAGIIYVSFSVWRKVSIRPGSSFGSLFGHITAQVVPNSRSILFVELDEEYPELAQMWDELRTELERQGFIEQSNKVGEKTKIEQFKFLNEVSMPDANPKAVILIVTVATVESQAVMKVFQEATGNHSQPVSIGDRIYQDLGEVNGARVFMAVSEMGAGGPGGSQQTVQKGITALRPSAVIMVGIAFGLNEQKQAIGDVLVAKQLWLYDLRRIGKDQIIPRGDKPHASTKLINRFQNAYLHWKGAKVHFGLVLTGAALVDNVDYRDQLKQFELEAIGGEMEGEGLYVVCQDAHVDWILVKAICDWADGNKAQDKDERQQLAADNAAQFVFQALKLASFTMHTQGERAAMEERSSATLRVEPFPRPGDGYASLKICNDGHQKLHCYAYLTKLVCVDNQNTRVDIKDSVNPGQARLTWHGGSSNGERIIDFRASETLNIARQIEGDLEFTLQDNNHKAHGQHFEIEVEIRVESEDRHISSATKWEGCIDLSPTITIRECFQGIAERAGSSRRSSVA